MRDAEQDFDDRELAVLEAGIDVPPPPDKLLERTLVAVGVGVGVTGAAGSAASAATVAAGAKTSAATAASGAVMKWVLVSAIGGAIVGGAIPLAPSSGQLSDRAAFEARRASVTRVPSAPSAPPRLDPLSDTNDDATSKSFAQPNTAEARPSATAPSARVERPVPASSRRTTDLAPEVAVLDVVRRALDANNPKRALALLDQYDAEFPNGRLASEARVMRVDATTRSGDKAAAAAMARQFLLDNPNSPHTDRLRKFDIAGGSAPSQ